jgi:hypothetical protein
LEPAVTAVPTETKSAALRFVLARLKEGSTLRGAIMILSAAGIVLRPEVSDAIVAVGMALAGLFGVLLPDMPTE